MFSILRRPLALCFEERTGNNITKIQPPQVKKYIVSLLTLACFTALPAIAQNDKINADRPGRTLTPEIVEKGTLQAEIGFEKRQKQKGDLAFDHPEADLRYGLSKRFEIRAEFIGETQRYTTKNDFRKGMKPLELGFKAKLLEEKGAMPAVSFFTHVGIPKIASKDHQGKHFSPEIRLLFENKLTDKLSLEYNVGPEWNDDQTTPQWFYSFAPDLEVGEKFEIFLEVFGRLQKGGAPEHAVDFGVGYYPTRDIKLDVYGGAGLTKAAPDYFISAGVSFRLKT